MDPITRIALAALLSSAIAISGCGEEAAHDHDHDGHTHAEGDGHDHDEHAEGDGHEHAKGDDHEHGDEVSLGQVAIGDISAEAFQGHGDVEAGKELHLIVKFEEATPGASTVRAWIGTDDRLSSTVAKAEYVEGEHAYELHAVAPDPLPENAMWWIEVEAADGTKSVGSVALQ